MISKAVRKTLYQTPDSGPTLHALTHGAIEIKPLRRGDKRGTIMARRVGMHERLYARGKITDAEWNWICRYVRETEIAAGARPGKPEIEPSQPWSGPMIYNRQCAAIGFLRRAHERISLEERRVLIAACVECVVVVELAPLLGLPARVDEADEAYRARVGGRVQMACARIIRQAATGNGIFENAKA